MGTPKMGELKTTLGIEDYAMDMTEMFCNQCDLWVQWEDWNEELEQCEWCADTGEWFVPDEEA